MSAQMGNLSFVPADSDEAKCNNVLILGERYTSYTQIVWLPHLLRWLSIRCCSSDTCTSSAAVAPLMRRTRSLSEETCAEEIFQITPQFFKTKGLIYEMFDKGISPDIKMFTSAESVISLSCLLTSSLDSSHVCNRFSGLKKKKKSDISPAF